ncbi:MAG TPA: hypothetical protein VJJ98_11695, partial [Sedimentisphaerales bacterium]|nr:hypothetical protein [Sedimentisphaerales bacterium]
MCKRYPDAAGIELPGFEPSPLMSLDTALKQRKRNRHTGSGRPGIVEQTTETGRRPVPLLSMRDIDELFAALGRSGFRSRFRLGEKEAEYLEAKGLEVIID